MNNLEILFAALIIGASPVRANAQPAQPDPAATPVIDTRLKSQERRIQNGKANGQLTEREAGRLENRQDKIRSDLDAAKADGAVTKQERAKLHRNLDRSSGAIAQQKHDRQHD